MIDPRPVHMSFNRARHSLNRACEEPRPHYSFLYFEFQTYDGYAELRCKFEPFCYASTPQLQEERIKRDFDSQGLFRPSIHVLAGGTLCAEVMDFTMGEKQRMFELIAKIFARVRNQDREDQAWHLRKYVNAEMRFHSKPAGFGTVTDMLESQSLGIEI